MYPLCVVRKLYYARHAMLYPLPSSFPSSSFSFPFCTPLLYYTMRGYAMLGAAWRIPTFYGAYPPSFLQRRSYSEFKQLRC